MCNLLRIELWQTLCGLKLCICLCTSSSFGAGTANGFDLFLQDKNGQGHDALISTRNQLLGMAGQDPNLVGVRPNGQENAPQYQLHIDHANCEL